MTSLVVNNITELIGNTPVVRLNRLTTPQDAELYVKLERFNPSGSVKDRAAYNLILQAELGGQLKPGGTIIEPTSGNTGIGLAMNAAAKGYKAILVMPDNMTKERINILKAYGAEVVLTPAAERMPGAIAKALELGKKWRIALFHSNSRTKRTSTFTELRQLLKLWSKWKGSWTCSLLLREQGVR